MKKFSILPCPHEATTSYGRGTRRGPAAILSAFTQVENFDEETGREMVVEGTLESLRPVRIKGLESQVAGLLKNDRIPIILGGEHSLTPLAVKAFAQRDKNLSVLQLDAHADLRDSYQGSRHSHACAMRRTLEICPVVQVGIRNIAKEEWEWAKQNGQFDKIHFAYNYSESDIGKIKAQLSPDVYITFDVDAFDPALVPATGTPEPGGLSWHRIIQILKEICQDKKVVGFDVVELRPIKDDIASEFTVAKLIYKIIGLLST